MFEAVFQKQFCNSNPGRTGAVDNNSAVFFVFAGYLQGIDDPGQNDNGCSVLVIMENRNIQQLF